MDPLLAHFYIPSKISVTSSPLDFTFDADTFVVELLKANGGDIM